MKISRRDFARISGIGSLGCLSMGGGKVFNSSFLPRSGPDKTRYDAWIELDLANMAENLKRIKEYTRVPVMAVIKANGYGHGLEQVGLHLDKLGIKALMVCRLQEAVRLRRAGVGCPIYNFGPLKAGDEEDIIAHDISPFIFSSSIHKLGQLAELRNKKINCHIHIDTGMNRMGIPFAQAEPVMLRLYAEKGLKISGVSTTLTEDKEYDMIQIKRLIDLCARIRHRGFDPGSLHAASSGGIFSSPDTWLDMVRPGIAIYGYYPDQRSKKEQKITLKPVLELKTRVAMIKSLQPGDSISYHKAYIAIKAEKIAVLPIGYSDGYPENVVGKALVLIKGERFPVIASITANHMEIKLPPETLIQPGDEVVLIGKQGRNTISADDLANWAGVSNYKILLRLNPHLPKIISSI